MIKSGVPVRLLQSFAGKHSGTMWVPRKNDEVLVAFENGDIDKPIVIGCAYNSNRLIPDKVLSSSPFRTSIHLASISRDTVDNTRKK